MKDTSFQERLLALFDAKNWTEARKLLKTQLRKEPDNHWLLTRISTTYYEEKSYQKAVEYAEKALDYEPTCPLARWDYAGALDMVSQHQKAIRVWESILGQPLEELAFDECGEGIASAKALCLDCLFRIGNSYYWQGEYEKAHEYLQKHVQGRYAGNRSIYSAKAVKSRLKETEEKRRKPA